MTAYAIHTRHWLLSVVIAALLGLAVAEAAHRSGLVARADLGWSDAWHRLAGVRHAPSQVALAVLDEETLAEHRDVPLAFWTPLFARAAAQLRAAGARVVAFDFLFTASPEGWLSTLPLNDPEAARNYDIDFRRVINSGGVLLAASRLPGESADEFLLPAPDYLLALPDLDLPGHLGLVDLVSDDDGAVRRFETAPALRLPAGVKPGEAPRLSFAGLIAARMGAAPAGMREGRRSIGFAGPPGTVPQVSLRRLLAPGAASDPAVLALRGKAVIVGANYVGMNDVHVTPYASGLPGLSGRLMAGAELQANVVETLLTGNEPVPLGDAKRGGMFLAFLLAAAFLFRWLNPAAGAALLAVALAAAAAVGYGLFLGWIEFPTAALQLGLLAAYLASIGMRLTGEERERARIGTMFGRYVSPEVVRELMASPELPELGGSAREVTVLFSDIRGFTTHSERLDPREVVEMLNAYFERACAVMLAEGGTIDKYIGDAIMVEFGAPVAQSDHARRALRAALALARVAAEFRDWMHARFPDRGLHEFAVGIGLHSGVAVVGNIGSTRKMEYTAIGDTVNTASRLEGATKTLGCTIVASDSTIRAAGPGVVTGRTDRIQVKGKEVPVEVFEVIEVIDATPAGQAATGHDRQGRAE